MAAVVAAGLAAAALTACGSSDPLQADRASAYFDAVHEAWSTDYTSMAQFAAADGVLDLSAVWGPDVAVGRAPIVHMMRKDWGFQTSVTADEPPYLAADGAVDPSHIQWDTRDGAAQAPVYTLSGEVFTEVRWFGSNRAGAAYGIDTSHSEALAEDYLRAWGEADASDVGSLYAPDATLSDSLLGISLEGRDAVAAAAASGSGSGGLAGATLRTLPEREDRSHDGGPATYGSGRGDDGNADPAGPVLLLADVPGEGDCPGPVAVRLTRNEAGQIVHEERYHRVDAVQRCMTSDQVSGAWWQDIEVPDPHAYDPTGEVAVSGRRITVRNSTPEREQLLRWAMTRFADGLVAPPEPAGVAFVPDPDQWRGYSTGPRAADAALPATAPGCGEDGCSTWPPAARAEALTALAQEWLADPARSSATEEFAERIDQAWADPDKDASSWGVALGPAARRAAGTVAWGLMDEPYPRPAALADVGCGQIAQDFLLLAGAVSAGLACEEPGGG